MSDRQRAAEILRGLPPHVARAVRWRLSVLRAVWRREKREPGRPRMAIIREVINEFKKSGRRAVSSTSFWRWERSYRRRGVAGLVGKQPGPRTAVDLLPGPAEVQRMGVHDLADVLIAVARRLPDLAGDAAADDGDAHRKHRGKMEALTGRDGEVSDPGGPPHSGGRVSRADGLRPFVPGTPNRGRRTAAS